MSEVMDNKITEIIDGKIDRSKWIKWKFSDLVENIVEKVVPKDSGLDHYIGLKHLDTGSLKIRRYGETESLIGNKLKIYKGDLIFAKRNSYLKRVAIADFDAVASAHSLVLRPKSENVNQDFLPFFMMSEKFWQRAIEISVGSLSPTINWKVLAKQEFLLPPKDQQAQLAKLLWAMDEVIEREKEVLSFEEQLFLSYSKSIFSEGVGNQLELKNIGDLIMGQSPKGSTYNENGVGMPFLQGNAEFGAKNPTHIKYTTAPGKVVKKDTILISVRAPVGDLNIADREYCIGRGLAGIYIENEDLRNYFFNFLKYARLELEKNSTGSTFKAINKDTLSTLKCIIPQDAELKDNSNKLNSILNATELLSKKIISSKSLQKSLINQVF
ncbi:restriction endonuclease subunit S [Urechidicola vernalis]|uniref:Restriction endonuclease subunit S n=1 Tax=Urechidicola vernalis TaxID=3075600 RepID=A0ABU2Y257_9FLAO|nr:restriction endonuclease subunit S [Urechidicola sp. P050]MDT0552117.1 restriction endonuclease subunit S [Urechidicola sp. P050]